MAIMTPEEFAKAMAAYQESSDEPEEVHINMDELMADLLNSLGYHEGVEIFRTTEKWYA